MIDRSLAKLVLILVPLFTLVVMFANYLRQHDIREAKTVAAVESIEKIQSHEKTKTSVKKKQPNMDYIRCMAENIYHEASGESFMGQVAVARVVMNRVKHGFASNPCKVIYQTTNVIDNDSGEIARKICQFSWVCEDKERPSRNQRYLQAEYIAKMVITQDAWSDQIPHNALFFHNTSVQPNWPYKKIMTIDNHVFYSKQKK